MGYGCSARPHDIIVVLTFYLNVVKDVKSPVNEILLGKEGLENSFAVGQVNSMQVFSLDFLLSLDLHSIEHSKLRDVEKNLQSVKLLVHDRVEAKLEFCQERKLLDVSELPNFVHLVEGQVQEPKGFDKLESLQLHNLVLAKVERRQHG